MHPATMMNQKPATTAISSFEVKGTPNPAKISMVITVRTRVVPSTADESRNRLPVFVVFGGFVFILQSDHEGNRILRS